jgi:hypothetical protein
MKLSHTAMAYWLRYSANYFPLGPSKISAANRPLLLDPLAGGRASARIARPLFPACVPLDLDKRQITGSPNCP